MNVDLSDSDYETEMANIIDDEEDLNDLSIAPIAKINQIDEKDKINIRKTRKTDFSYQLSQHDMLVLNNIVKLSLVIIIISIAIIIMGILMIFTSALTKPLVFMPLKRQQLVYYISNFH